MDRGARPACADQYLVTTAGRAFACARAERRPTSAARGCSADRNMATVRRGAMIGCNVREKVDGCHNWKRRACLIALSRPVRASNLRKRPGLGQSRDLNRPRSPVPPKPQSDACGREDLTVASSRASRRGGQVRPGGAGAGACSQTLHLSLSLPLREIRDASCGQPCLRLKRPHPPSCVVSTRRNSAHSFLAAADDRRPKTCL